MVIRSLAAALLILSWPLASMAADQDPGISPNVVRKPILKLCADTPEEPPILGACPIPQQSRAEKEELGSASPKWGDDFLVDAETFTSTGRLSLDHAENGDLFVGSLNPNGSPQDTFFIYKSTDHGENWSLSAYYATNTSGSDSIVDGIIRVGRGANPWVYMFVHCSTSGGRLWFRRFRADFSAVSPWVSIMRGDSLRGFTVDRNAGDTLFIALHHIDGSTYTNLRVYASFDSGDTWASVANVAASPAIATQQSQIVTGGDGNVFLSYLLSGTNRLRLRRYTDNIVGGTTSATYLDSMFTIDTIGMMALAAQRSGHRDSQTVWVLNVHKHAGANPDIHLTYSTDGGQTWSATTEWPFNEPSMNTIAAKFAEDYPVPLVVAAAKSTDGMQLITGWSNSADPGSWNNKDTINDYRLTGMGSLAPAVDLVYESSGTQVIYKRYGTGFIYTDWWGNTASGVMGEPELPPAPSAIRAQARPNPAGRSANICFQLNGRGKVRISLYDLTGRRMAEIFSGELERGAHQVAVGTEGLSPGVYIYRIVADGRSATGRMVIAR